MFIFPGLPQPNNMINQPQNPQLHPQFSHPLKQPQPQIHVMTNNPVQHMPMNQPTEANQVHRLFLYGEVFSISIFYSYYSALTGSGSYR